jgi:tRNA uridine 5-carbamoylmethylation protein Kti12
MFGRRTKREAKKEVDPRTPAVIRIQCAIRVALAKTRIKTQAKRVWQRVYDPKYKRYFWFNKLTKKSRWDQPRFTQLYYEEDRKAAIEIERVVRGFIGRMRVRKVANTKYTRFYDGSVNKFYWLDKSTGKTTWNVSQWLLKQQIEMPTEDRMLYESYQKIKEVRKKRFEELEPEVIRDKVQDARHLQRPKNMDEWTVEELSAWFIEMKMEEYIPFLFRNR